MTRPSQARLEARPPKDTFVRLPEAKRERLLEAAFAEIAAHDYEAVNLDRISAAARVAKGSLYQYFDRKADLYAFAVLAAVDRAGALFRAHLAAARPADALAAFGEALWFAVELRAREPVLAQIYWRVGLAGRAPAWLEPAVLAAIRRHNEAFQGPLGASDGGEAVPFILDAVATRFHRHVLGDGRQYGPDRTSVGELRAFAQSLAAGLQHVLAPPAGARVRRAKSRRLRKASR